HSSEFQQLITCCCSPSTMQVPVYSWVRVRPWQERVHWARSSPTPSVRHFAALFLTCILTSPAAPPPSWHCSLFIPLCCRRDDLLRPHRWHLPALRRSLGRSRLWLCRRLELFLHPSDHSPSGGHRCANPLDVLG